MININDISEKINTVSLGVANYSKNKEINEEDVLYLQLVRKIIFCDDFDQNIDNLPDNIIDIKLGKSFQQKINKFPKNLINLYIHQDYEFIDTDFMKNTNIKNIVIDSNKSSEDIKITKNLDLPNSIQNITTTQSKVAIDINNLPDDLNSINISKIVPSKNNTLCNFLTNKLKHILFNATQQTMPTFLDYKIKYLNVYYLTSSIECFKENQYLAHQYFSETVYNTINYPNSIKELDTFVVSEKYKLPFKILNVGLCFKSLNPKIKINNDSLQKLYLFGDRTNLCSELDNTIKITMNNKIGDIYIKNIKKANIVNIFNNESIIKSAQIINSNISISEHINISELNVNNDFNNRFCCTDIIDLSCSKTTKIEMSLPYNTNKILSSLPITTKIFSYKSSCVTEDDRLKDMMRNIICYNGMMNYCLHPGGAIHNITTASIDNFNDHKSYVEIHSNNNIFSKIFKDRIMKDMHITVSKNYIHDNKESVKYNNYTDTEFIDIEEIIKINVKTALIMLVDVFDVVKKNNRRIIKVDENRLKKYFDKIEFVAKSNNENLSLHLFCFDYSNCNILSKPYVENGYKESIDEINNNKIINMSRDLINKYNCKIYINFSRFG